LKLCAPKLNLFIPDPISRFIFSTFTVPGFASMVISASLSTLNFPLQNANILQIWTPDKIVGVPPPK